MIVGRWSGWKGTLEDLSGNIVYSGVSTVDFCLWHNGTRWVVQHMIGQIGGNNFSCY